MGSEPSVVSVMTIADYLSVCDPAARVRGVWSATLPQSDKGRVARNPASIDGKWRSLHTSGLPGIDPHAAILDYFRVADHPPGISVSLQVEHKPFIGNGHLIGSSLR